VPREPVAGTPAGGAAAAAEGDVAPAGALAAEMRVH